MDGSRECSRNGSHSGCQKRECRVNHWRRADPHDYSFKNAAPSITEGEWTRKGAIKTKCSAGGVAGDFTIFARKAKPGHSTNSTKENWPV